MSKECRTYRRIDNGLFSTTSLWHRFASRNSNESHPDTPRKNCLGCSSDELGLSSPAITSNLSFSICVHLRSSAVKHHFPAQDLRQTKSGPRYSRQSRM